MRLRPMVGIVFAAVAGGLRVRDVRSVRRRPRFNRIDCVAVGKCYRTVAPHLPIGIDLGNKIFRRIWVTWQAQAQNEPHMVEERSPERRVEKSGQPK